MIYWWRCHRHTIQLSDSRVPSSSFKSPNQVPSRMQAPPQRKYMENMEEIHGKYIYNMGKYLGKKNGKYVKIWDMIHICWKMLENITIDSSKSDDSVPKRVWLSLRVPSLFFFLLRRSSSLDTNHWVLSTHLKRFGDRNHRQWNVVQSKMLLKVATQINPKWFFETPDSQILRRMVLGFNDTNQKTVQDNPELKLAQKCSEKRNSVIARTKADRLALWGPQIVRKLPKCSVRIIREMLGCNRRRFTFWTFWLLDWFKGIVYRMAPKKSCSQTRRFRIVSGISRAAMGSQRILHGHDEEFLHDRSIVTKSSPGLWHK